MVPIEKIIIAYVPADIDVAGTGDVLMSAAPVVPENVNRFNHVNTTKSYFGSFMFEMFVNRDKCK